MLRVGPDVVRPFIPLNLFGYVTDPADRVVWVGGEVKRKGFERLRIGDRVRIDRIKPFDRKPGLAGVGYSRDNPNRQLPVERDHRVRELHLASRPESWASRTTAVVRVFLFLGSLALGAMLYLLRPSIATGAIFFYALAAPGPTTFSEVVLDNPAQQIPVWIDDVLHGAGRAALLLFATCLLPPIGRIERSVAIACGVVGFALGNLNAFVDWSQTYGGHPHPELADVFVHAESAITILAVVAFAIAFVRSRADDRRRIGSIAIAFALAGVARVASDVLFPGRIPPWQNGLLLSATILPLGVVWISVLRDRFFEVDFVVGRAIVYTALTGAMLGIITLGEEIGTYVFYQNTDLAYGFLIVISTLVGMASGKLREVIQALVDRFVFPHRRQRRRALGYIAGYVLDAESSDDVYRALLQDTTHALGITFAGVFVRSPSGSFDLERAHDWPNDLSRQLAQDDPVVREVRRTRASLEFEGKKARKKLSRSANERISLVAPLISERNVVALVAYGRNVSGLNIDSDERERLARLVAYASLAIAELTLAERASAAVES